MKHLGIGLLLVLLAAGTCNAADPILGAALYSAACQGCHGPLATTTKPGRTAAQIQSAITANLGGMRSLASLTSAQIADIAIALPPAPTPPPGASNGDILYTTNCQGCHGALATSTKLGRTAAQIQNAITANIGGMGFISLTPTEIAAIASSLATTPAPTPAPGSIAVPADGATLYGANCQGCHGALATSTKIGRTATQIQNAITANIGGMGLINLTSAQLTTIANALATTPAPTPIPTATPTPTAIPAPTLTPTTASADGATLYNTNCSGCHAPLATSTKKGRTAAQIQSAITANIGGMGLINLTSAQLTAIANALAVAPAPTPTAPPTAIPPPPTTPVQPPVPTATPKPAPTPVPAATQAPTPVPTAGPSLYTANCQSCHGPLTSSTKRRRTAAQIQSAITANVGGMGSINLTSTQIAAIAIALTNTPTPGPVAAHQSITTYNGPANTCIAACHADKATEMLNSIHVKWAAPTPELTNTAGGIFGKAMGGINTFATYPMSSKNTCFGCHVRADGNAPHTAQAKDVDCLMCHSDTYERKFVPDPAHTETVTNVLGKTQTYVFGQVDRVGNYITKPDFSKMPTGTSMVTVARNVHLPTTKTCLRCHGTADDGDWAKRGDMGLNMATATIDQDVHLAKNGANLTCVDCHSALNHKIGGRGIDLRGTEAPAPACQKCHTAAPHVDATLNRHAAGQVSCQVCHIRTFGKGGATEMSRDWQIPEWNPDLLDGQGGFIGKRVMQANVKPEYIWFDGTSYVYNVGETINPDAQGVYHMAKANGTAFDGKSSIVPIKRHSAIMPLHESGRMVPPAIMWMFMTGRFGEAVQKGMLDQGMTGTYTMVKADAEMLITHGVDPKIKAPKCAECHNSLGNTPDGTGMVPFTKLGYHTVPAAVKACTQCHGKKTLSWSAMHAQHRNMFACTTCHTTNATVVR